MTRNHVNVVLVCMFATLVLSSVSCSSSLSRGKAAELISKGFESDKKTVIWISFNHPVDSHEQLVAEPSEYGVLARLGYLDCQIIPAARPEGGIGHPQYCGLQLTSKGNQASVAWEVHKYQNEISDINVPVAKPELVDVTGITLRENEAAATYTWKLTPINDIGKAVAEQEKFETVASATAYFQKFDDGWRLRSLR
jgi:hypothetical protein